MAFRLLLASVAYTRWLLCRNPSWYCESVMYHCGYMLKQPYI